MTEDPWDDDDFLRGVCWRVYESKGSTSVPVEEDDVRGEDMAS